MSAPFDGGPMTPAQHLEAAIAGMTHMGWTDGRWELVVHVENGHVRAVVPKPIAAADKRATVGRRALDVREPAA